MSAAETLAAAQAAGVRLGLDGTDLLIEGDCAPPPELLDALRRDKPEILALLGAAVPGGQKAVTEQPTAPDLRGLTLEELQEAAGEDWPEVFEQILGAGKLAQLLGNAKALLKLVVRLGRGKGLAASYAWFAAYGDPDEAHRDLDAVMEDLDDRGNEAFRHAASGGPCLRRGLSRGL